MFATHASTAMPRRAQLANSSEGASDLGTYPDRIPIYKDADAEARRGLVQLVLSVMQDVIDEIARGAGTDMRSAADRAPAAHDG